MFFYVTGDLLRSDAEALVNTVNCEGYMGKGIAYQFKLQFPDTNADYVRVCKRGALRPGQLHYFREQGKIIINFPTKDKWREKSRIEYIEDGLDSLIDLVYDLGIKSIAIPPLGSGNGGLKWNDVKEIISNKLENLSSFIDIFIYEPSKNYSSAPYLEPKLSTSALVLMEIKHQLETFDALRLQKAAYFMNLFSPKKYFNFVPHKFGPYDHSIDIISKGIREFQQYHKTRSTEEAQKILYNKLISNSVNSTLKELFPQIQKACDFVNSISSNHELECLSTICFLIEQSGSLSSEDVISGFKNWSEDKAKRFTEREILYGLQKLYELGILEKSLIGYSFAA
ncbi:MAG: macro domain-containing protein [Clostridiales bacterium]|nr:macro domain-containing protein [Clostridiales bacterium]